jgi:hypothetical protein
MLAAAAHVCFSYDKRDSVAIPRFGKNSRMSRYAFSYASYGLYIRVAVTTVPADEMIGIQVHSLIEKAVTRYVVVDSDDVGWRWIVDE